MIAVEITRARANEKASGARGRICNLKVHGHADSAVYGEDIVCAAASVTMYTTAGALVGLCGAREDCAEERDGFFEIAVPVFKDEKTEYAAEIITETAYIGFMQIEASYGKYIRVRMREEPEAL